MNTAVIVAVIIAGLYFVTRHLAGRIGATLEEKRQAIGSAIGERLYTWLHPEPEAPEVHFGVLFPDGSLRSVSSLTVDSNGFFKYWRDGSAWRLAVSESGKKVAVPV